jgi:cytochrome bd-type quinol oxidase subunit 1
MRTDDLFRMSRGRKPWTLTGVLGRILWVPVLAAMAILAVFFFAVFASLLAVWIVFVLFRLWKARRAFQRAAAQAKADGPLEAEYRVIEERERITRRRS